MRLSTTTLDQLRPGIERFAYDRDAQAVRIVHLGIGAFHRAHQAWYTDQAMDAGDRDWMIAGVSLRSAGVAQQINPQDGLYSVVERSAAGEQTRVVGAVREVLVARTDAAAVAAMLAAPSTHIVSFTVTEKGYCRAPDGSLDFELAGQESFYPHLSAALRSRRSAGLPGLTLLSCDNLSQNGKQLQRLITEYLERHAPELIAWFEAECACPATMVDRIVPATTAEALGAAEHGLGLCDEAAVMTEPFTQWVIEDRFAGPRPRWENVGAELVSDVAPYETAKLRMLNGAHSALAYLGLERGHTYVHEAIADPTLRLLLDQLIREEAATSFEPAPAQNLNAYADALLARFENPALKHRLSQIAMDGSQKIPQRWLVTLAAHQARGQQCPAILTAMAAWLRYLRDAGRDVDDPMAEELVGLARSSDLKQAAKAIFGREGLIASDWAPQQRDLAFVSDHS